MVLDAAEVQKLINDQWTEREFQAAVISYAELRGWRVYAVLDTAKHAKRTLIGYPDLTMFRNGRLIFAELKSERGKVTTAQAIILNELRATGAYCYVWRPRDWTEIEAVLE